MIALTGLIPILFNVSTHFADNNITSLMAYALQVRIGNVVCQFSVEELDMQGSCAWNRVGRFLSKTYGKLFLHVCIKGNVEDRRLKHDGPELN